MVQTNIQFIRIMSIWRLPIRVLKKIGGALRMLFKEHGLLILLGITAGAGLSIGSIVIEFGLAVTEVLELTLTRSNVQFLFDVTGMEPRENPTDLVRKNSFWLGVTLLTGGIFFLHVVLKSLGDNPLPATFTFAVVWILVRAVIQGVGISSIQTTAWNALVFICVSTFVVIVMQLYSVTESGLGG